MCPLITDLKCIAKFLFIATGVNYTASQTLIVLLKVLTALLEYFSLSNECGILVNCGSLKAPTKPPPPSPIIITSPGMGLIYGAT